MTTTTKTSHSTSFAELLSANDKVAGDTRREYGRAHFTKILSYVLSDVSHPELALLADWACNEEGNLHTSQISHLRNAKMKMLGVKSLDGLGRISVAAFLYFNDRETFNKFGTATVTARIEEILQRFQLLIHPQTGFPLNAGDLMMIYLGYLTLDILPDTSDDVDWEVIGEKLGPWLEDLLEERGLRFREAAKQMSRDWTGTKTQQEKFLSVAAGFDTYKPEELSAAWSSIVDVVSSLIDEKISETDLIEMITA